MSSSSSNWSAAHSSSYRIPRQRMVERLREHYRIRDPRVLEAMLEVPRHLFVPEALQGRAYGDHALPIDANQTISQPYIVARMTELLEADKSSRVLGDRRRLRLPDGRARARRRPGLRHRAHRRPRAPGAGAHTLPGHLQRDGQVLRRHDGLERARALRLHPRRRGRPARARASARSAQGRRPPRPPRRRVARVAAPRPRDADGRGLPARGARRLRLRPAHRPPRLDRRSSERQVK